MSINRFSDKQMINEAGESSNKLEIPRTDMDRLAEHSHRPWLGKSWR